MKSFVYRGFDSGGARKRGVLEALDLKDAREKLARSGVYPDRIDDAVSHQDQNRWWPGRTGLLHRAEDRIEYFRAVGALLNAGIPLAASLEILMEQPPSGASDTVAIIAGIRDRIRDGAGFAEAMMEASVPLSSFEKAVLESGERTGCLSDVLVQVSDYLEEMNRVRQSLKTACIYPALIVALALVVGTGLLGFLVPKMAEAFEKQNVELPLLTQVVVAAGDLFLPVVLPSLLAVTAGGWFLLRQWRARPEIQVALERRLCRAPVIGRGFRLLVAARFARTCSLLLRGGVSVVDAMALSGRATGSVWLAGILKEKAEAVRQGLSFSLALASVPILDATLASWARAGEATGDVPGLFHHAAERYRYLWEAYIRRMVAMVEPALILIVALFVLLVALAILLPVQEFSRGLG